MSSAEQPVVVRDAATVVLLRQGEQGLEVYLQRRVSTMVFAAGVHVFPGGVADPADGDLVQTAIREVAEETGVELVRADVRPWSRWITPEGEPRRYDTRFFVAVLPGTATPTGVGTEMDTTGWWKPDAAVAAGERGEIVLWPPTLVTLLEVSEWSSPEAVLAASSDRDLEPVLPVVVRDPGGYRVRLPDGRELGR